MKTVLMQYATVDEFVANWQEFCAKYDYAEQDHIKRMWEIRAHFVPA